MKAAEDRRLKLYHALCLSLSNRLDQVAWGDFTPADWRLLAPMAKAEGVAPLLYWTFQHADASALKVPAKILSFLAAEYYKTAAHNMLIYRELGRILVALKTNHVPVIILKGAALALSLYDDMALRPMGDVDLLVPHQNIEAAIRAIYSCGYQTQKTTYHVVMRNSTPPKISIELHWNIISDIRSHLCSSIDWFWEQAEEWHELYKVMSISNDNDSKTFILSPTACIIYLSTHLMIQHTPSQPRLLWYYDLYKLLSKSNLQLDWETLPSLAKDLGLELALYDALYNLTERFDVFFPENVLNDLVREHLKYKGFIPRIDFSMQSQAVNTWIWNSLTTVPSLTRLKMVFHLLFPNPAYMRMRYNPHYTWLWPLYYFLRILSILKTSLRIN